ncbi:MAG: phospholipase D-like domain-containing protein [Bacteroidia bacterium]
METEVHFNNISNIICSKIKGAKYNICIAVTWFTDTNIIRTLIIKAKENIHIDLILDQNEINLANKELLSEMQQSGINILFYSNNLMHNKFCLVDLREVITGSYNYSRSAHTNNENIIINSEINVVDKFIDEFKIIKSGSIIYEEKNFNKKLEISNEEIEESKNDSDFLLDEENEIDYTDDQYILDRYYYDSLMGREQIMDYSKDIVYGTPIYDSNDKSFDNTFHSIFFNPDMIEIILANYFNKHIDYYDNYNSFYKRFQNIRFLIPADNEYITDDERIYYAKNIEKINKGISKLTELHVLIKGINWNENLKELLEELIRYVGYLNGVFGREKEFKTSIPIDKITIIFMTPSIEDSLISTNELRNDFIKNETYRSSKEKLNLFSEAKDKEIDLIIFPDNDGIAKDIVHIPFDYHLPF